MGGGRTQLLEQESHYPLLGIDAALWDALSLAVLMFSAHACLVRGTEIDRGARGRRNGLCLPVCRGCVCGDGRLP